MPLSEPPESLAGFPEVAAPQVLYRVSRTSLSPIYYSGTGAGRFDLLAPRGTLYCSASGMGAFIEVFRTPLVPSAEVAIRSMSMISLAQKVYSRSGTRRRPSTSFVRFSRSGVGRRELFIEPIPHADQLQLADCTDPSARRFGITAAIHSTPDYALCQRWAAAFAAAGFGGIKYLASHDPSSDERSVAIFDDTPKSKLLRTLRTSPVSSRLIAAVEAEFGIVVVPTP